MYWSRCVKMLITKRMVVLVFHRDVAISKILFNPPNIKMLVISNLRTHFLDKKLLDFYQNRKTAKCILLLT